MRRNGSLEGKYRDVQGRLYRLDAASGKTERLGASFDGSLDQYTLLADGRQLALGLKGTETQVYLIEGDKATKLPGIAGSYAGLDSAHASNALLLRLSTINDPQQVYLAADPLQPDKLKKLTSFQSDLCRAGAAGMAALYLEVRRRPDGRRHV